MIAIYEKICFQDFRFTNIFPFCSWKVWTSIRDTGQLHGDHQTPTAYVSFSLDPIAKAYLLCLRAIETIVEHVKLSLDLVLRFLLTIWIPILKTTLLLTENTQQFLAGGLSAYEILLFSFYTLLSITTTL